MANWNRAIRNCIPNADWKEALELLRQGAALRLQDIISYNSVLQSCRRASQWQRAWELLQIAPKGLKDVVSISTVVSALEDTDHWHAAVCLLQDAQKEAIELNIVAYGAAASCARRCWQRSAWLLQEARNRGLEASLIAHNNAMTACEDAEQWEQTLGALEELCGLNLELNAVVISSATSAASRTWETACCLLRQARAAALELDAVVQNTVITATGRGLRWPLALHTFAQAIDAKTARVRSYRATIAAVSSAGWAWALWLLSSMVGGETPRPDLECFSEAMFACVQSAPWEICIGLLEAMQRRRCPPDLRAYGCAARACGLGQAWQQALQMMGTRDPTGSLWNAVAWACQAAGRSLPATPTSISVDMRKEHDVVKFVRQRAQAADLHSVLSAIEAFADGRKWLKVAGGRKAFLLQLVARRPCRGVWNVHGLLCHAHGFETSRARWWGSNSILRCQCAHLALCQ